MKMKIDPYREGLGLDFFPNLREHKIMTKGVTDNIAYDLAMTLRLKVIAISDQLNKALVHKLDELTLKDLL